MAQPTQFPYATTQTAACSTRFPSIQQTSPAQFNLLNAFSSPHLPTSSFGHGTYPPSTTHGHLQPFPSSSYAFPPPYPSHRLGVPRLLPHSDVGAFYPSGPGLVNGARSSSNLYPVYGDSHGSTAYQTSRPEPELALETPSQPFYFPPAGGTSSYDPSAPTSTGGARHEYGQWPWDL